jgi:polyphosphate kinase
MEKRVEILFPIFEADLKKKLKGYLQMQLVDNVKAREQNSEGIYQYVKREEKDPEIDSQLILTEESMFIPEDDDE